MRFFLLLPFLFLLIGKIQGQRDVKLSLKDSMLLRAEKDGALKNAQGTGPLLRRDARYYCYDRISGKVHVFGSNGQCRTHYMLTWNDGEPLQAMGIAITEDLHYFSWFGTFTWKKPDGTAVDSEFLGWGEEDFSFSQRVYSQPSLGIDEERGLLLMPILPSVEDTTDPHKLRDRYYELYEGKGVLAVYPLPDLDGKKGGSPTRYIGDLAPVYKRKAYLPHLDHLFWSMDKGKGRIYLGQMASPRISVHDLKGAHLRTFGKEGGYIDKNDTLWTIPSLPERADEARRMERRRQALSPTYGRVLYDSTHRLTWRSYHVYGEEKKGEMIQHEGLSWKEWFQRQLHKPTYLQVYDHANGDSLVMDRSLGKGIFRILAVDGRTLYVNGGIKEGSKGKALKIYEYAYTVEE